MEDCLMTDYKAKQEVWKGFENLYGAHNPFNPLHSEFVDTILELRSRVEALEANSSVPHASRKVLQQMGVIDVNGQLTEKCRPYEAKE